MKGQGDELEGGRLVHRAHPALVVLRASRPAACSLQGCHGGDGGGAGVPRSCRGLGPALRGTHKLGPALGSGIRFVGFSLRGGRSGARDVVPVQRVLPGLQHLCGAKARLAQHGAHQVLGWVARGAAGGGEEAAWASRHRHSTARQRRRRAGCSVDKAMQQGCALTAERPSVPRPAPPGALKPEGRQQCSEKLRRHAGVVGGRGGCMDARSEELAGSEVRAARRH